MSRLELRGPVMHKLVHRSKTCYPYNYMSKRSITLSTGLKRSKTWRITGVLRGCLADSLGKSTIKLQLESSPSPPPRLRHPPFFHHYQGSIDFNTVNIHRTVGMYFLVSTGNRGDIEWHDLQRSYYPIHSLLPGVYVSILSLGTVFPRTLPMANIRNTSSRGKHWQCSSNDADKLNVDICRQAKWHYIGCTIQTKLKQYKQKIIQIVLM